MSPAAAAERLEKLTRDEVPVTRFTLLEIGEGLQRASAWLQPTGSQKPVAVWRGDQAGLISIDLRAHPDASIEREGVLEVGGRGGVEFFPSMKLASVRGGTRLFATPKLELPPPDALFLHGGETIRAWLASFDWKPEWGNEIIRCSMTSRGPSSVAGRCRGTTRCTRNNRTRSLSFVPTGRASHGWRCCFPLTELSNSVTASPKPTGLLAVAKPRSIRQKKSRAEGLQALGTDEALSFPRSRGCFPKASPQRSAPQQE